MKVEVETTPIARVRDDALVLFAREGEDLARRIQAAGRPFVGSYRRLVDTGVFKGAAGDVQVLVQGPRSRIGALVLAGLGSGRSQSPDSVRTAAARALRQARDTGARSATLALPRVARGRSRNEADTAEALVEGALLGLYRFENHKTKKAELAIEKISIATDGGNRASVARGARQGTILGEAVALARDLGNEPSNTATPTYLAETAAKLAEAEASLSVEVLEQAEMERLGMGSLLGVSQGSAEPPKFIILTHEPRKRGRVETIAFVGKGITFDTGGISIKPAAKLEEMKFDMCGGAAVLGAMRAVAQLGVGVRVVGIVPAVENMPSGTAYKPGDIVTAMDGTTIEVKNTDAEGRMILADALAYVASKLKPRPRAVVDIATLTGACVVALGNHFAGLMSNHEGVVERLEKAAKRSGDPVWRLPLTEDYARQLESPYADVCHLGTPGAGAVTAAAFLERFPGRVPWAHLDVAGTAWTSRNEGILTTGATGFGVRLLARFAQGWSGR